LTFGFGAWDEHNDEFILDVSNIIFPCTKNIAYIYFKF